MWVVVSILRIDNFTEQFQHKILGTPSKNTKLFYIYTATREEIVSTS